MNVQEYQIRINMIAKAKIMFPDERNLSIVLERYLETIPEAERIPVFISSADSNRPLTFVDNYIRPCCPECEAIDMMLGILQENEQGYKTFWECQKCDVRFYSTDDIDTVLRQLERKDA